MYGLFSRALSRIGDERLDFYVFIVFADERLGDIEGRIRQTVSEGESDLFVIRIKGLKIAVSDEDVFGV